MNTTTGIGDSSSGLAGKSPEEIEQRIEGTREQLTRTLDALESRLSPRRRLTAATESARQTGERLASAGLRAVTPHITTMIRVDHSHVLALFRRFKAHTPLGKKRALVANACLALEVHAQLEEEIFYPALRDAAPANPVLEKSVPEHDNMRKVIANLRTLEPGDPNFDETFRTLMREVLHHVADEETTLLPLAEELLGDELGALGLEMTKRRMELLAPHAREVALTSARSFPLLFAGAAAGLLTLGWLALRPRERMH